MTERQAYRWNWILGILIIVIIAVGIYMELNPK